MKLDPTHLAYVIPTELLSFFSDIFRSIFVFAFVFYNYFFFFVFCVKFKYN